MSSTKDKYEKYRPKKRFGQNFLVDDNISRKIVSSLNADKNDLIIEIGPGLGALTKFLINDYPEYRAVEIDKSSVDNLIYKFGDKLNIICSDFLEFDLDSYAAENKSKIKVIGNIPYNITSGILFKLLESMESVDSAVLMVQKEVAERLVASSSDTKKYGILAVQFQAFSDIKMLFSVPRTAFFPKPDVTSAVIKISFKKNKYDVDNITIFRNLVRNAFSKRRKTLKNSLKDYFDSNNIICSDFNLDFSRRAETLSVQEFVVLSNEISSYLNYGSAMTI
ncbi:MAG: 16S rRNA (adenine(1518)-N(6)/adenine(1519)-N(6))-dimethyltransferase RsmA [Ignavibacteria bacterium]|nr:16S rRNA (adenine(1518)-N(6)/adenine(1519)-N(6))-dimethyltransferase RsmA [Ignavibacteria bacterium]